MTLMRCHFELACAKVNHGEYQRKLACTSPGAHRSWDDAGQMALILRGHADTQGPAAVHDDWLILNC